MALHSLSENSMTTKLTDDLRQALEQEGSNPVYLVDATTNANYVIMRADQYEKVKALFEEEEFNPRELYPLVERSLLKAGWDDPAMDEYNDYDTHRSKS
jgi:hypothetical protein